MIQYWKINQENDLSTFFILKDEAIWISKINELEISIEQALKKKMLFDKTRFIRFHDLKNLIFDKENSKIHFNYIKEKNEPQEKGFKLKIPNTFFTEIQDKILEKFSTPLKDLNFIDRFTKPIVFSLLSTFSLAIGLYFFGVSIDYPIIIILAVITFLKYYSFQNITVTQKKVKYLSSIKTYYGGDDLDKLSALWASHQFFLLTFHFICTLFCTLFKQKTLTYLIYK